MKPERRARNRRDDPGVQEAGDPGKDALSGLARGLRVPVEAPGLWKRIEEGLPRFAGEPRTGTASDIRSWRRRLAAAAAAVVLGAATLLFLRLPAGPPPLLLVDRDQAERLEREHRRLEARLSVLLPVFREKARSDGEAALFAADQLAYIDNGIEDCRRALLSNPLNRAVRHALLACTRKKMEVVRTFLNRSRRNEP